MQDAGDFLLALQEPVPDTPFEYVPGVFPSEIELSDIKWEQRSVHMYGRSVPVPRLLAMYGQAYTYSGIHHPARALPESLERLRLQVEERVGRRFNSALCNLYRDGSDSVSWHSDNDYGCGDQPWVASVSFGGTRRFKIRRNSDRKVINFEMESGSLLLMKDLAQVEWEHCVPKTSRPVSPRINITFRHIG